MHFAITNVFLLHKPETNTTEHVQFYIAFRPENENELILCHGGIYEKHEPLTFSLASIDINQGIIYWKNQTNFDLFQV